MGLNFLSGLLLTAVALAAVGFLAMELIGDRVSGQKKARRFLADVFSKRSRGEAKPVGDRLIGSIGKVVSHSDDSARPMRVRLQLELWAARLDSAAATQLPIGTAVKVMAIDGLVLVVVAETDVAESPHA